jgi:predicted transcriptional regulator
MIMLTKDKVRKTIDRLPEKFTVDQIVEELVILNRIEEGLKDVEEGSVFTTDQVKKELKTWLK